MKNGLMLLDLNEICEPTAQDLSELEELGEDINELSEEESEDDADEYYSEDSIKMYMYEMGRINLLTSEEEKELGKMIAEGGEKAVVARNKLVEANLRLAMFNAKKFIGCGMSLEDVNSMAIEGLIRAAEKFDYTKGFKFSTYATWWVRQSITRGLADEGNLIRIPVHLGDSIQKVKKAQKLLSMNGVADPTVDEIAEYTGIDRDKVENIMNSSYNVVSFDLRVGDDKETTLGELIKDENSVDPGKAVEINERAKAIDSALSVLTEKEALVLKCRFGIGLEKSMTLEEIAHLEGFGVTRERVRQIETKALRKIKRSPMAMNLLKDFAS